MYRKNSQDQVGFLAKVDDNEPIFILRARDALSPYTIRAWIGQAKLLGVNQGKIDEAEKHLQAFDEWQAVNATKLPD